MYAAMWEQVEEQALRLSVLPPSPTNQYLIFLQLAIIKQLTAIFADFKVALEGEIVPLLEEAYTEGLAYSSYALEHYETREEARKGTQFTDFNRRNLDTLTTKAKKELLSATSHTEQSVKDFIRREVAKTMAVTGGKNIKVSEMQEKAMANIKKQMLKEGLEESDIAIIDAGKRKWKLKNYLDMAVKTQLANAHMQGIRDEAIHDGSDLAIISTKPDTSDACLNFEGMVISLNGLTSGYPTYEGIRASKLCFHPRCGHFVRPVGGIDWVPKEHQDTHNKKLAKYRKWEEQQKESQSV
jgi:hypothetical protein